MQHTRALVLLGQHVQKNICSYVGAAHVTQPRAPPPDNGICDRHSTKTQRHLLMETQVIVTLRTSRKNSRRHLTTAQQHAQSWRFGGSSPCMSHHPSGSRAGHPQHTGAVTTGGCGWLVSRAINTRLKSPAPQGASTTSTSTPAHARATKKLV